MAIAIFCSECGERIKGKRSSSLLSRSFCSRCSPGLDRARLMLIAVPVLCGAIGFAIGHFTATGEPFYYIGTPVESGSSGPARSADDNTTRSSRSSEAVTQRERPVVSPGPSEAICGARTKAGKPCQRKVKGGGYCWQHRDKVEEKKPSPAK